MLFRKKNPPSCTYCKHGVRIDEGTTLCAKRGVVKVENGCFRFSYDPCKRIPAKPKTLNFIKYKDEDFSL